METILSYRGITIQHDDVCFFRSVISEHPELSRRALSKKVCELRNWRQPNGALRDMVCRGLMLALHRGGHITLPPVRKVSNNPLANRRAPRVITVNDEPIACRLKELGPLAIQQVRRTPEEQMFNSLLSQYHYLGYVQPVGEHLKFLVSANNRPIACLSWSSAPRHLAPRDRFIGWNKDVRRANIRYIAYNSRYLIMPWVTVPHLASHVLGQITRMLPIEWNKLYDHLVYYAETFIDPERFAGTCYKAANWQYLGMTTGRGKDCPTRRPNRSFKQVLGYPLHKRFRKLMGSTS